MGLSASQRVKEVLFGFVALAATVTIGALTGSVFWNLDWRVPLLACNLFLLAVLALQGLRRRELVRQAQESTERYDRTLRELEGEVRELRSPGELTAQLRDLRQRLGETDWIARLLSELRPLRDHELRMLDELRSLRKEEEPRVEGRENQLHDLMQALDERGAREAQRLRMDIEGLRKSQSQMLAELRSRSEEDGRRLSALAEQLARTGAPRLVASRSARRQPR